MNGDIQSVVSLYCLFLFVPKKKHTTKKMSWFGSFSREDEEDGSVEWTGR